MLLGELLAVVEEQFLANIDIAESDEFDAVFAIDEHDLGFAVQAVFLAVGVIDEAGFVAVARRVDDPVPIEVEEEREEFAVVDDPAALCFGGGDDLEILAFYRITFGVQYLLPRQHIHSDSRPSERILQRIVQSQHLQVGFHPLLVFWPLPAAEQYFDSQS